MTVAQQRIEQLDKKTKQRLIALFGTLEIFYEVFYLMMQNEHQLDVYRPDGWSAKLSSVQYYRRLATERLQKECAIDADLLEDIYSDYFEDFANYRERAPKISNEEFLTVLKKLIV